MSHGPPGVPIPKFRHSEEPEQVDVVLLVALVPVTCKDEV